MCFFPSTFFVFNLVQLKIKLSIYKVDGIEIEELIRNEGSYIEHINKMKKLKKR